MADRTKLPNVWKVCLGVTLLTFRYTEGAPSAYEALDTLRGRTPFNPAELKLLMKDAQPGVAYPTLSTIPQTSFSCDSVQQAGFYSDPETQCQVYHRCEPDVPKTSYLCPNGTLFSPVILVCDYW
ncbi:hypothetical protein RvY_07439-2 [Ramazzottius varieornatus]|uniref:Chitin-binding type-2 domain-containing protein n=1 Tax=Ramazzottius varieornatus TaxID=947166 RepID=A0A1D1V5B3_RAMVA|nr:hypothetical protein RvY_07439-2 [Ramazzottius varieornatus]